MDYSQLTLRDEWLVAGKAFCRPDWGAVWDWCDRHTPLEGQAEVATAMARDWMRRVARAMPVPMQLRESPHFILVLPTSSSQADLCLQHLEIYRGRIAAALRDFASAKWIGKSVVLVAPDAEQFARYLTDYYPDGEFMMPGGVCLNAGYTHFVLPDAHLHQHLPVFAHELCHVFLRNTNWPLWLEEAVVQTIEHKVTRLSSYVLDRETIRRHRAFWTPATIQEFWTGSSFQRPDEGSELSYHLALFLLNAVNGEGREAMATLLRQARREDAGFAAFTAALGLSPAEVVANLLDPAQ